MNIKVINGKGISGVATELSVFELHALNSKIQSIVNVTLNKEFNNAYWSPTSFIPSASRVLSSLTVGECSELFNSLNDLATFISKLTQDTPSAQEVDKGLFKLDIP